MNELGNIQGAYPVNSMNLHFRGTKEAEYKAPEQKEDGDNKLKKALIALGAIGAAGAGLYILHKKGKHQDAAKLLTGGNAAQGLPQGAQVLRLSAGPDESVLSKAKEMLKRFKENPTKENYHLLRNACNIDLAENSGITDKCKTALTDMIKNAHHFRTTVTA